MRSEQEVFRDIARLCVSPGYAHALAFLCYRDNFVGYNGELEAEDLQNLYSPSRLIGTEISTLVGLMLKSELDFSRPSPENFQRYIDETDQLLEEFHGAITSGIVSGISRDNAGSDGFNPFGSGSAMREPIFYSGESAYSFQYTDLATKKYSSDNVWLETNKGFDIETAATVVKVIREFQSEKIHQVISSFAGTNPSEWTVLAGFTFTCEDIAGRSGIDISTVSHVVAAFTASPGDFNTRFEEIGDFNIANASPIVRFDKENFTLFQAYSLCEALYESPFYWMCGDDEYLATAMTNRGSFTEQFSLERLRHVFGHKNVHANVDIYESKSKKIGEVDVLVVFGDRAIVLQAKSKRLTIEARKGNDGQIRSDFGKSIQDSYAQGLICAKALVHGTHRFVDSQGHDLNFPFKVRQAFLLCVVSDHYPALAFQSRQYLEYSESDEIAAPYILDVFTLDVLAEFLDSPLRFLSYIQRRTGYFEHILASQELTILAYHLKTNLWVDEQYTMLALGDDIGSDLDVAMSVRRDGVNGRRTPDGILTRLGETRLGELIKQIEADPNPAVLSFGFMLLTLNEKTVEGVSHGIEKIIAAAKNDGDKYDLTVGIGEGKTGLTIHTNDLNFQSAHEMLHAHCLARKYTEKAASWFGICLSPKHDALRFGVSLEHEWQQDEQMDAATRNMPKPNNPRTLYAPLKKKKVGRNDLCPCGSGQKYKKCCLQ